MGKTIIYRNHGLRYMSHVCRPGLRSTVPIGCKRIGASIYKNYCTHFSTRDLNK